MSRSTVELDIQTVHSEDMGEVVGEFYGTPIREWFASSSRTRENADTIQRLESNRASEARILAEGIPADTDGD